VGDRARAFTNVSSATLYQFSEVVLQIQALEAWQIPGFAIQNRQSKIQN